MIANLIKPRIEQISIDAGKQLDPADYLIQEKSDGQHRFLMFGGEIYNAELMASGEYVINDVVQICHEDVTMWSGHERWEWLFRKSASFAPGWRLCQRVTFFGEIQDHISAGWEGAVAKPMAGNFGEGWIKIKRVENFICRVSGLNPSKSSVSIVDATTGQARGNLALRLRFDRVRVGSLLKVVAMQEHKSGLLREARLDNDTPNSWLVRF